MRFNLDFPLRYGTGKMPVPQKPVPQELKLESGVGHLGRP